MRIEHLIDGALVAGAEYFETRNPATQEVLAQVARGGPKDIDAAVGAAKAAFPRWAGKPAAERARLLRRLGDLIAEHVPDLAKTETQDTGQVIAQTAKQLVPRAADNFYYFAEMCVRVDGHTYPTATHLNYTLFHPVGVCALISPWNVPFMTSTWKVAPALAFGNTAVLENERAVAAVGGAAGRARVGGRNSRRGAQRRARLRRRSGRAAVPASRRAGDLLHGFDGDRRSHRARRRA